MIARKGTTNPQLEVISPDDSRVRVALSQIPFLIGRGEDGNHLALPDKHISRQCASIITDGNSYFIEDRGHRLGIFVDGRQVSRQELNDGAVVSFGLADSFKLQFLLSPDDTASAAITQVPAPQMDLADQTFASGRDKLSLLLEATSLLHSQLPLEAVLHAMLDRAITITNADRGLLMEVSAAGALRPWLARRKGSNVPAEEFAPSQTAVDKALKQQSAVVTEDVNKSGGIFDSAQSIIAQRLRTVVAMPLYAMPRANTDASILRARRGEFLGLLYLDSQRPAAFSMSAVRGNGRGGQRELSYRNSVESAPGGD
jgi:predicted component of type VI protein secretion system